MKRDDYLLDTDTIIYWLKDKFPKIKYKISQADKDCIFTSSITVADLYFGAYYSSRKKENLLLLDEFLREITIISFDENAGRYFGEFNHYALKVHRMFLRLKVLISA